MILTIFLLLTSYLIGSIPTAYWIAHFLKGIDIREHGSGNCGATNVFRIVGKTAGLITLFLDALKGYIPVFLILRFAPTQPLLVLLAGLSAICGHNWTLFLKFKGGKGVATSTGVLLALMPLPTLIAVGVFLAGLFVTRHVSVGSLLGSLTLPVTTLFFGYPKIFFYFTIACALLILALHKKNIERLIKGEESKISLR